MQTLANAPARTSGPIVTPTLARIPASASAPVSPTTPAISSPTTAPPAANAPALPVGPSATIYSPPDIAVTASQPFTYDATPLAPPASTLTPTAPPASYDASPEPTSTATPAPRVTPDPIASPPPSGTPTSTPTGATTATPTSTSTLAAWSFAGLRLHPDPVDGSLLVFGEMVNNTGLTQELSVVSAEFYDAQGEVIAQPDGSSDYWPLGMIPPGGRTPFELIVADVQGVASVNLSVNARPSGEVVRQDFEFSALNVWNQESAYCVEGALRNPGGEVQAYLVIAAVLYDAQSNVVNFGDYYAPDPGAVAGDAALNFSICIDPPNSDVARYELRAWGR